MKLAILGTRGVPANYGGFETFAEELGWRLADRGLWVALVVVVLMGAWLAWGTVPADGFLRDPATGDLLKSPFMSGMNRSMRMRSGFNDRAISSPSEPLWAVWILYL